MNLEETMRQKSIQLELPLETRGEASDGQRSGEVSTATNDKVRLGNDQRLMEMMIERTNATMAFKRVRQNRGSPGIDEMTVEELPAYLKANWERIRKELLAGTYQPRPVKQQMIPKPGGGMRQLGIPTVLDRLIQQCILQVLQPRLDPSFSNHSYGFRPGRRAHDAVCAAQRYIQEGRRWVVDIDLEKFFDRVNHDLLMGRLSKRIADRRVLGLIRRYLEAGVLCNGIVVERYEGTPQGGPLSPLLANVLLDEVDRELEKRGHAFCRYADDCNVYVRSRRAGERVMEAMIGLYEQLKLKVNSKKSAVARVWERKFLGFSFWVAPGRVIRCRVAPEALKEMKDRIRRMTRRNGGRSLNDVALELREYLTGWKIYFRLAQTPRVFSQLDEWIRHRLRALQFKQWKHGRTIFRELRARGIASAKAAQVAAGAGRWWHTTRLSLHIALPNKFFDAMGIPYLRA